jgi:hypothetical protein
MSLQQRREVAYWFMLLVGIALMTIQLVKYWEKELDFSFGEIIITVLSVALMILPRYILRVFEKFINSNKNEK